MKKSLILSSMALLLTGGGLYWFMNRHAHNEISVITGPSLSADKVKIQLGFYSINEDSDRRLVQTGLGKTLFDGKAKGKFETKCGENDFYITYNNEYYTLVRHFIPNDFQDGIPEPHQYNFAIHKSGDKMIMNLDIAGPDGEKHVREMAPVSAAGMNRRGLPINTDTTKKATNIIAYFEIQSSEPEREVRFYTEIFGWKFEKDNTLPLEYYRVKTAGINGGLLKRPAPLPASGSGTNAFTCSIQVENFDRTSALILKNGGQVAMPKFAVPGKCWQGYFTDPDNNTFGIIEADTNAK
jgi:uncharacterized protein